MVQVTLTSSFKKLGIYTCTFDGNIPFHEKYYVSGAICCHQMSLYKPFYNILSLLKQINQTKDKKKTPCLIKETDTQYTHLFVVKQNIFLTKWHCVQFASAETEMEHMLCLHTILFYIALLVLSPKNAYLTNWKLTSRCWALHLLPCPCRLLYWHAADTCKDTTGCYDACP